MNKTKSFVTLTDIINNNTNGKNIMNFFKSFFLKNHFFVDRIKILHSPFNLFTFKLMLFKELSKLFFQLFNIFFSSFESYFHFLFQNIIFTRMNIFKSKIF